MNSRKYCKTTFTYRRDDISVLSKGLAAWQVEDDMAADSPLCHGSYGGGVLSGKRSRLSHPAGGEGGARFRTREKDILLTSLKVVGTKVQLSYQPATHPTPPTVKLIDRGAGGSQSKLDSRGDSLGPMGENVVSELTC